MTGINTIKVSVIVPAYNQAHFLDKAIQSVFAQTFTGHEIIVVDDGSTDETPAVAGQFGNRIRYIRQENRGLAGARNTGIRAAKGELVALLDSDDAWVPTYLDRMVVLAERHPEASVFYCAARCMDADGNDLPQTMGYQPVETGQLYWNLLRANFIIPSTVTMRRAAVIQAGFFDDTLRSLEDWDLWLRLLSNGHSFVDVPDVLVQYRVHGSSLSTNTSRMQQSKRLVVEKHFGLDDGLIEQWEDSKRRVYGDLYLYQVLINIQRQNNWQSADALRKALLADPTIKDDLSVFYELALGNQPVGWRGSPEQLDLPGNAQRVTNLLAEVFAGTQNNDLQGMRQRVYTMVWKALVLAAYNTGQFSLSRKFLLRAVRSQPNLLFEKSILGILIKSFLGARAIKTLRGLRHTKRQQGQNSPV